jgi:hypothetical protein
MQRAEGETLVAVETSQRAHNLLRSKRPRHELLRNNQLQLSRLRPSPQREERHRHNLQRPQRPPLQQPTGMRAGEASRRPARLPRLQRGDPRQPAISRLVQFSRQALALHLLRTVAAMHRPKQPAPIRPMREPTRVLLRKHWETRLRTPFRDKRQVPLKWLHKQIRVRPLRMLKD